MRLSKIITIDCKVVILFLYLFISKYPVVIILCYDMPMFIRVILTLSSINNINIIICSRFNNIHISITGLLNSLLNCKCGYCSIHDLEVRLFVEIVNLPNSIYKVRLVARPVRSGDRNIDIIMYLNEIDHYLHMLL